MGDTDSSDLPIYLDRTAFNPPGADQIGPENMKIKLDHHLDLLDSSDSDEPRWMFEVFHPLQPGLLLCCDIVRLKGSVLIDLF